MDRRKERYDAHYELWRMGEPEASDDRIDNLLDLGYSGEEAAGRVHQDRENIREERRFHELQDFEAKAEEEYSKWAEEEYSKYCEREYQERAEEEYQKLLEDKKFLEEWHCGQEPPDGKNSF